MVNWLVAAVKVVREAAASSAMVCVDKTTSATSRDVQSKKLKLATQKLDGARY